MYNVQHADKNDCAIGAISAYTNKPYDVVKADLIRNCTDRINLRNGTPINAIKATLREYGYMIHTRHFRRGSQFHDGLVHMYKSKHNHHLAILRDNKIYDFIGCHTLEMYHNGGWHIKAMFELMK